MAEITFVFSLERDAFCADVKDLGQLRQRTLLFDRSEASDG